MQRPIKGAGRQPEEKGSPILQDPIPDPPQHESAKSARDQDVAHDSYLLDCRHPGTRSYAPNGLRIYVSRTSIISLSDDTVSYSLIAGFCCAVSASRDLFCGLFGNWFLYGLNAGQTLQRPEDIYPRQ